MTSQWQVEIDDAGRPTETSRGFPARIAAAIVILAALIVCGCDTADGARLRTRRTVAYRANHAVGVRRGSGGSRTARSARHPSAQPSRVSHKAASGKDKGHACVAFVLVPKTDRLTSDAC